VKIPGLGANSKPTTTSTACSVNTFAELRPMLASILSFWEWEAPSTALIAWSLWKISVWILRKQAC